MKIFNKFNPEYQFYLKSEQWRQKCLAVRERDRDRCVSCGSPERLSVHHKTYENLFNEFLDDLVLLCSVCHPIADFERKNPSERKSEPPVKYKHIPVPEFLYCPKCNRDAKPVTDKKNEGRKYVFLFRCGFCTNILRNYILGPAIRIKPYPRTRQLTAEVSP